MTEIPMPGPESYQPPPKSSAGADCCKIGAIICVVLIIGMVVIAVLFMGSIMSFFGGGSSYSLRTIASYSNENVELFGSYYYDEFYVSSSETMTSTSPDVQFEIDARDTGSDDVTVTIHFAIYSIDITTFDSISTWGGLDSYLVEDGDYIDRADDFFNINNYADTYVWVIWFEASSKTDVWGVDIDLTLRYNWNL